MDTRTRGSKRSSDGARYVGTTTQGIEWWAYSDADFATMVEAFDAHERTISDRLLERGLGHRESASYGKRQVFHIATGEVLGRFTAGEAVETFLRAPVSAEVSS